MRALGNLPYSLAKAGPSDIDGVGNCAFLFRCLTNMALD